MEEKQITVHDAEIIMKNFISDWKNKIKTSYPDPYLLSLALYHHVNNPVLMYKPRQNNYRFETEKEKYLWYKRHFHICCNRIYFS